MGRYIGSRYVPKIEGEWNNLKEYESLSIVIFNNTSYTSKRNVPIGIDINNKEYWVITGNYNGKMQELENVINNIQNGNIVRDKNIELIQKENINIKEELKTSKENITNIEEKVTNNTNAINEIKLNKKIIISENNIPNKEREENTLYLFVKDKNIITNNVIKASPMLGYILK